MARGESVAEQQAIALAAAEEFANEDARHCEAIGRHGAKLIRNGMRVLTHCNAGWLAFVDVGSATAPIYAAQAAGRKFHVFCDETRPAPKARRSRRGNLRNKACRTRSSRTMPPDT
jgi:methylthioribose-1-phosphate isomerase